jgi:hypothetical protein
MPAQRPPFRPPGSACRPPLLGIVPGVRLRRIHRCKSQHPSGLVQALAQRVHRRL